jgi:hypothetical protein
MEDIDDLYLKNLTSLNKIENTIIISNNTLTITSTVHLHYILLKISIEMDYMRIFYIISYSR